MKPRALVIALTFGALVPVPAVAQEGSGLYTPSPHATGTQRAKRFVDDLLSVKAGRRVKGPTRKKLEGGIFRPPLTPSAAAAPTHRATADDDWLPSPAWPAGVLPLAAAAALALRRWRPTGAGR